MGTPPPSEDGDKAGVTRAASITSDMTRVRTSTSITMGERRRSLTNVTLENLEMNEQGLESEVIGFTGGRIFAPYFADGKMEREFQKYINGPKLKWGRMVIRVCLLLVIVMLLVNCMPPFDMTVWAKQVACVLGISILVAMYLSMKLSSEAFAAKAYDFGIIAVGLLGLAFSNLTADRVAEMLNYEAKTWTLVALQEANASLFSGLLFSMVPLFCRPRLQATLAFYCIAIPLYIYIPVTYGSKEFELMEAATDFQYDMNGNATELWPHPLVVLLRTAYLACIGIASYLSLRNQEVQQRSSFALYYITSQKLETARQLKELQMKSQQESNKFASAVETMSVTTRASTNSSNRRASASPYEVSLPEKVAFEVGSTSGNPGIGVFAKGPISTKASWETLLGVAGKISESGYTLKGFFEDCKAAIPELGIFPACSPGEFDFAYQHTISSLFSIYWIMRLPVDGHAGMCYGVDEAWKVKGEFETCEMKPVKLDILKSSKEFFGMSSEEKRQAFIETTGWSAFNVLAHAAGMGEDSDSKKERVAALLCVTVLRGLMRVEEIMPTVQAKDAPYRGNAEGTRLTDSGVALAYILEKYPHLLPTFGCLPAALQRSVLAIQGHSLFDYTLLVHGEAPPSMLVGIKSAIPNSEDMALFLFHWFADLAGSEGTPLRGAEKIVIKIPHVILALFLCAAPHLTALPATTETRALEMILQSIWEERAMRPNRGGRQSSRKSIVNQTLVAMALPEDEKEAAAQLRLFALAQSDYRVVEAYKLLDDDSQEFLQKEFLLTGCLGQCYDGCDKTQEGPAIVLPGLSTFLQLQAASCRENIVTGLHVLCTVLRAARTWFPLKTNPEVAQASVLLKDVKTIDVDDMVEPATGDLWLLVRKSAHEAAMEKAGAMRLNELNTQGITFLMLDFSVLASGTTEVAASTRPLFHGKWKCVDTWGMDEFLQGMGVGRLQRMAAAKAPWPAWSFVQDGDMITFTNHSAMGELREKFIVDGPGYTTIDGWKREITCKATWEENELVIMRSGPEGHFREERHIDDSDRLCFTLAKLADGKPVAEWGRQFVRAE